MSGYNVKIISGSIIEDPLPARFLFSNTHFSVVWLIVRVLIGYNWIGSALEKLNNPGWMQTGEALRGLWIDAVTASATVRTPITTDWYGSFIQGLLDNGSYVWFARLIVFGELLIGIALIVGAFVGVTAVFAALMSWNFIMDGSTSNSGLLLLGAIILILAWKNAGFLGLDYFLLPRLGVAGSAHQRASEAHTQTVALSLLVPNDALPQ